MAFFWELAASCLTGEDAKALAEAMRILLRRTVVSSSPEVVDFGVSISTDDGCVVSVTPVGGAGDRDVQNNSDAPSDPSGHRFKVEVGEAMYEALRQSGVPFLHASLGVEVSSSLPVLGNWDVMDLLDGQVFPTRDWICSGRPAGFLPFDDGHVWIPWLGVQPCVKVRDCVFHGSSSQFLAMALTGLRSKTVSSILVHGEKFGPRDVDLADDLPSSILNGLSGQVRLGPCRICGRLTAYDGGRRGTCRGPEDSVACVLRS
jgi:hypothetical protein